MDNMDKREVLFAKKLEEVKRKAREQGSVISREEVEEAFQELSLEKQQLALVLDYLKKHKIGIGKPADTDKLLEKEDRNYLTLYLKELKGLEQVSEKEREAAALSAMAGEKSGKEKLIHMYLQTVVDLAKLYTGQGVALEDLIGEGNVALAMGAEMVGCLESPSEIEGMLGKQIMDAMEAHIAETNNNGTLGKKAAERTNKIAEAARELSDMLFRKVTVKELAEESGFSEEEIREVLRLSANKIEEIETDGSDE